MNMYESGKRILKGFEFLGFGKNLLPKRIQIERCSWNNFPGSGTARGNHGYRLTTLDHWIFKTWTVRSRSRSIEFGWGKSLDHFRFFQTYPLSNFWGTNRLHRQTYQVTNLLEEGEEVWLSSGNWKGQNEQSSSLSSSFNLVKRSPQVQNDSFRSEIKEIASHDLSDSITVRNWIISLCTRT